MVNRLRASLSRKLHRRIKVGHAGTLDPLATGVVIVVTGKSTKLIESLQQGVKEYVATLQFGATTPSFDLETEVDQTYPCEHITQELIIEALKQFQGEIMQVPPVYSACKIQGRRAYDFARNGEELKLAAKPLCIDQIELISFDPEKAQAVIRVVCSKGTYIRALARDIGSSLNSGAHLIGLRRTRVGDIKVDDCLTVDQAVFLIDNTTIEPLQDN